MRRIRYVGWLLVLVVLGLFAGMWAARRPLVPTEHTAGRTATLTIGQPSNAILMTFSPDKRWLAVAYRTCYHLRQSRRSEGEAELSIGDEPRCWHEGERAFRYTYKPLLAKVKEEVSSLGGYTFSPDRSVLAWIDPREQEVSVWEASTGELVARYSGYAGKATSVAFSADNQMLAVATRQGSIYLWDRSQPSAARRIRAHRGAVTAIALSRDRSLVATAGEDRTMKVWRIARRGAVRLGSATCEGVSHLAFDPSGKELISHAQNGETILWKLPELEKAAKLQWRLPIQGTIHSVGFSADGENIEVVAEHHTLCLWNLAEGKLEAVFEPQEGLISCLAFAPDSGSLLIGDRQGRIHFWRLGEPLPGLVVPVCEAGISALSLSPDGKAVYVGTINGEVHLLYGDGYRRVRSWLRAHKGAVLQLAQRGDGSSVMSVGDDGWLVYYPLPQGQIARQRLSQVIQQAAFSEWGDKLVFQDVQQLAVWETTRGATKPLFTYPEQTPVSHLHLVSNYLYVVTGSSLYTFRIDRGIQQDKVPLHRALQTAVALSPDGSLLALGEGGSVTILSRQEGTEIAKLKYASSQGRHHWLITLPSGEYACPESTRAVVRWHEGGRLLDETASLASAYRPEEVRQRLRQVSSPTPIGTAATPPR